MSRISKRKHAVDVWTLHYQSGTSDKFYQVFVSETGLTVLRWGRRNTAGQSSVAKYKSYDEARDQGLKQVFAKKSKGYSTWYRDQKFLFTEEALTYAHQGHVSKLVAEWQEALRTGANEGVKQTVLRHYDDFSERVQTLLNRAGSEDLAPLSQELEGIEEVWKEISDKHAEVSAALDLAKMTLFQRMMASD